MSEKRTVKKHATLSENKEYRYWLERSWQDFGGDFLNFVMLNPSTADDKVDDHTIRKCMGFAERWGYVGFHVVNLFALRSTDPNALYGHPDPIGPENNSFIEASAMSGPLTIVAWGNHGNLRGRDREVLRILAGKCEVKALGFNKNGTPKHPLMVSYDTPLVPVVIPESNP